MREKRGKEEEEEEESALLKPGRLVIHRILVGLQLLLTYIPSFLFWNAVTVPAALLLLVVVSAAVI